MLDPGNPACLILRTRKTNFSRCFTANYRYHFAISILITLRQLSPHDILLNTTDVKDLGCARHQPSSTIINHRSQGTTFAVKSQGMSFSVLVWMPSSSRVVRHFRTGTWWFGTFFIFPYIGNHNPDRLSYFSEG